MNQYAKRKPIELDQAGGYYCRHVSAMTTEDLYSKADIAAELGWRDMQIDQLTKRVAELESQLAWTPVSKGLPTEPGVYELTDGRWSVVDTWCLESGAWWYWTDGGRIRWHPMMSCAYYTHYRLIELPTDGET